MDRSTQPPPPALPNSPQLPPPDLAASMSFHPNQPLLTDRPCCPIRSCLPAWAPAPLAVTVYASGWVALWSSLFGVWSGLFYAKTGRFIYPFLGGLWAVRGLGWWVGGGRHLAEALPRWAVRGLAGWVGGSVRGGIWLDQLRGRIEPAMGMRSCSSGR